MPVSRSVIGIAAAAALVAGGQVMSAASAVADPAGSVTLASGLSGHPLDVLPLSLTADGMAWADTETPASYSVIPEAGGGAVATFKAPSGYLRSCLGTSVLTDAVYDEASGLEVVAWYDLRTGDSGTEPLEGEYLGPLPNGFATLSSSVDPVSGAITFEVDGTNLSTGLTTPRGTFTNPVDATSWLDISAYQCDQRAFAMSLGYDDEASDQSFREVLVGTVAGSSLTQATSRTAAYGTFSWELLGLSGRALVYAQTTATNATLYRFVSGGTPIVVAAAPAAEVVAAAATDTYTAYVLHGTDPGSGATLYVQPVGGSATMIPGLPDTWGARIWPSSSDTFVVGVAGQGQYQVGPPLTAVWTPETAPLRAEVLALSAGRATWADDQQSTAADTGWTRTVTGTSSLSMGTASLVVTHMSGSSIVADGRRTAWVDRDAGHLAVSDGAGSPTVTGQSVVEPLTMMSGHRAMTWDGRIADLVSGTTTAPTGVRAIWGNTGVGVNAATGALFRRDLTTGAQTTLLTAAAAGVPTDGEISLVAVQGDVIAWSWYGDDGTGWVTGVGWRNLVTGHQGALTPVAGSVPALSVYGGLVGIGLDRDAGSDDFVIVDAASDATVSTTALQDDESLGAPGLGWVDAGTHEPKVSPLTDQHLAPRHEGNPFAPTSLVLDSAPWHGEWVFTEPLTSCSVDLATPAGAVIRTIACDPAFLPMGEAVVDWDGTTTAGTDAAAGSYVWSVHAADADGPARDLAGTSTSITGGVTVVGPVFTALTPYRLLDTRAMAVIPAKGSVTISVTGRGGVPSAGVDAVALNVTAVSPAAAGWAVVYPTGGSQPTASTVNFVAKQTVANLAIVKVGSQGSVTLYSSAQSDALVDVVGFYPTGSGYTALAPTRILDTRSTLGGAKGVVAAGRTVTVKVAGAGGVPASGAQAAVLNVTAVTPATAGFLTVFPAGAARPTTSSVTYDAGLTTAGLVVAKLGTGGSVQIYTSAKTHLLVDVLGWVPTGSDYHGLTPARILDTRIGKGAPAAKVGAGKTVTLKVTGVGGVPSTGPTAVLLTVTATQCAGTGFVTVYPYGATRPTASNLNCTAGGTVSNSVIAKVGTGGKVVLYTSTAAHLIADVSGYWTG